MRLQLWDLILWDGSIIQCWINLEFKGAKKGFASFKSYVLRGIVNIRLLLWWYKLILIDNPSCEDPRILGRSIDPDLCSDVTIELVKGWLRTCLQTHDKCSSQSSSKLPTRVIDVGPADGSEEPRLLVASDIKTSYITFSYCWGKKATPRTTLKTLQARRESTKCSSFPKSTKVP